MKKHKGLALKLWLSIMCNLALVVSLSGQEIPVGHWRHHLPNNTVIAVAETPEKIIGATSYGLVVYNKEDSSVEKIDKVQGLTDFGITSMAYDEEHELLLLG